MRRTGVIAAGLIGLVATLALTIDTPPVLSAYGGSAEVSGIARLDGAPLADVAVTLVTLKASDFSSVASAHLCTEADGSFTFSNVPTDPSWVFSLFTGPNVFCENKKFFEPATNPDHPLVAGTLFLREPVADGEVKDVGVFAVDRLPAGDAGVVVEARETMVSCFDTLDPAATQSNLVAYRDLVDASAVLFTDDERFLLDHFASTVDFFLSGAGCRGWFSDDNGHVFEFDIEWMADEGITRGCNPPTSDRYCPDSQVTRGQMAAFLVRALDLTDQLDDPFIDDDDSIFEADIERLAAAGITRGCNPPVNDRFCPDSKVTRGQMAAFLVRALGYLDDGGGDLFIDDDDSIFEGDIDKLGTAGVTKGCNPPVNDRYCPNSVVTRGQMAAFLHRALA